MQLQKLQRISMYYFITDSHIYLKRTDLRIHIFSLQIRSALFAPTSEDYLPLTDSGNPIVLRVLNNTQSVIRLKNLLIYIREKIIKP